MRQDNVTSVYDLLHQMSTEQLDEMLLKELHSESIDENAVRMILRILRERDKNVSSAITPKIEEAYEKYQQDIRKVERVSHTSRQLRNWGIRIASAAALVMLFISLIPQQVGAESLWDRFVRWTGDFVEFFGYYDNEDRIVAYEFKTENSGLQQVYDAVAELGITDPVVPMWLPDGYELTELNINDTLAQKYIYSRFEDGSNNLTYQLYVYDEDVSHKYQKDDTQMKEIEIDGTVYHIMRNNDMWVAVWTKEKIECSIFVNCQEEILHNILGSIYAMEDK